MIVHGYSFSDGRYVQPAIAQVDPMNPGAYLIPGYHTPDPLPDSEWLQDGEYFVYLNENGEPPRRYQDGAWEVRKERQPVTAWCKTDGSKQQFEDVSEVPDDYTIEPRFTQFDVWTETGWQTDEQAKFEAEVKIINDIRRSEYARIVDPLMNEARMLRMDNTPESIAQAEKNEQQALTWYQQIKDDHPWPESPATLKP